MKNIYYEPVGALIVTDPNSWVKVEYDPFNRITRAGSETWRLYFFLGHTPRGKIRVYESYGRSKARARESLLIALSPGRNKPRTLKSITKAEFKLHYKKRKSKHTK